MRGSFASSMNVMFDKLLSLFITSLVMVFKKVL